MRRALIDLKLTRADVELAARSYTDGERGSGQALETKYGADRLVVIASRVSHGSAPTPQLLPAEPSVLATDQRGQYVLLRAKPVEQVVYQRVNDCHGVQGVRALMTVEETVAILPKGARVAQTVDVPFLKVVVVTTRPPECSTIP